MAYDGPATNVEHYGNATTATKQTVASQLEDLANVVSKHSEEVAIQVSDRLAMVSHPIPDSVVQSAPQETWPPYFATMRGHLESINRKLYDIEECLHHLEL